MTRMIWQSFKECVFCKPEKRQYLRLTHICLTLLMSWRKNVKLTSAVTWKLWLFGFLGFPLMLVSKSSFFWDIYALTACIHIAVSQHTKVYSRVLLTFCWSLRPPALGRQSRHSWTLPVAQLRPRSTCSKALPAALFCTAPAPTKGLAVSLRTLSPPWHYKERAQSLGLHVSLWHAAHPPCSSWAQLSMHAQQRWQPHHKGILCSDPWQGQARAKGHAGSSRRFCKAKSLRFDESSSEELLKAARKKKEQTKELFWYQNSQEMPICSAKPLTLW